MKFMLKYFAVLFLIVSIGCSGSKEMGSSGSESQKITSRNLADYISSLPRLSVRNGQVYNTSASSFQNTTRPLFVIDGVQMGRDFGRILSVLDESQELEVQFIKMSRATIRFGEEGRNGAIIIKRG